MQADAQVHEAVLALKTPGLALDHTRHGHALRAPGKSNDGAIEIIAPVAYIATNVQVIFHSSLL